MKGRLITLEGGEGAGKTTLLAGLRGHFQRIGMDVLYTREPGGTPVGEAIRALVLDPAQRGLAAETELLLMFAARAQLVREVLRPALESGRWVLCDRFTDASYAYQGGGRGVDVVCIAGLESIATGGLKPDLTLLLDLPVTHGRARANQRGDADRIEAERDDFFERVRAVYRDRAQAEPARFRVIDASLPAADVLAASVAAIEALQGRETA
ncbi:MAG: dTMP kinase [Rhodanobacteraceae bacterium]|nr:MAG: dTMP kinase [Rhodanobacteraceae bacterium]